MHAPSGVVSPSPSRGRAKADINTTDPSPFSSTPTTSAGGTNLHDLSSLNADSFELPRVPLWRILLAAIGYVLLITDVARSGASLTELAYPTIEPNVFASSPPALQPIRVLTRHAATDSFSVNTTGDATASKDSVDSHVFKFAATSNGLRTLLMQRPEQLSSWSPCLHSDYSTPCARAFPAKAAFRMLNEMMDTVRNNANLTTCYKTMMALSGETLQQLQQQQHPAPDEISRDYLSTLPQRVRFAVRAKSRWIDGASNFLSHYLLDKKYWLSIWATHFDDFRLSDPGMEICADELDRPLLCEKTWADFQRLSPNQDIDKIWDDLSNRAATLQRTNPTKTLEMTIIETETDPLTLFGGAVVVAHKLFDVVALYRLLECSSPHGGVCETVEIHDVRYSGRILYTDAIEWRYITMVMRWSAQAYVLLRLVFLLVGCYHAAPLVKGSPAMSRLGTTLTLFFGIPPQVVAYASLVPVLLYACAHVVDGVVLYHILADRVASFAIFFANPVDTMVHFLSIHMRTVWLVACAARVAVFMETSGGWTPLAGVTGLKGYLLPLLSLGAVLFVLRDSSIEDARILESNEVEPSATFMFIRAETLDSWKMNAGGVYRDMLTVGLAACAYILGFLLLHTLTRCLRGKRKDASWWPQSICWSRCDVPYAAGYLWDPSCLVVVWENDLVETVLGTAHVRPRLQAPSQLGSVHESDAASHPTTTNAAYILSEIPTRVVLMNLTFLSDPWTYLSVQFGHTRLHVYALRYSGDKTRYVLHPYSKPRFLREFEMKADDVALVATASASDMDWRYLILCR